MAPTRERRSDHDPGRVLRDLAVMLTDGGDCPHEHRALRDQVELIGGVASDATDFRVIDAIDEGRRQAIRAPPRASAAGATPSEIVLDVGSTLITARSDMEGAALTYLLRQKSTT